MLDELRLSETSHLIVNANDNCHSIVLEYSRYNNQVN